MNLRTPILTFLLAATLPAAALAATADEAEAAAGLTRTASDFLDQVIGRGRYKVYVSVQGESSEVHTQTEVLTPMKSPEGDESMPGYVEQAGMKVDFYQKDVEKADRRPSFRISRIHVALVLDKSLPGDKVNSIRAVLPDLLRMETTREDELVILRAELISPWKSAWMDPSGIRLLLIICAVCALLLLLCFLAYLAVVQAARVLGSALAARQPPAPALPAPEPMGFGAEKEAELTALPGGLPSLEGGAGELPGRPLPALGQRFDFLASAEVSEVGSLISSEQPGDLALLFASLTEMRPDLASTLFGALPSSLQSQVSDSLVKLVKSDPEKLEAIEGRLRETVELGVRGPDRLGRILSRLSPDQRETLLGELMDRDPDAAQSVRDSMFPFEAVGGLEIAQLRRLIMAVPYDDWAVALRGADAELTEKILAELPAGTRDVLRDAMQAPQPRQKVLETRTRILSVVFEMAAKGQITIKRKDASAELI